MTDTPIAAPQNLQELRALEGEIQHAERALAGILEAERTRKLRGETKALPSIVGERLDALRAAYAEGEKRLKAHLHNETSDLLAAIDAAVSVASTHVAVVQNSFQKVHNILKAKGHPLAPDVAHAERASRLVMAAAGSIEALAASIRQGSGDKAANG